MAHADAMRREAAARREIERLRIEAEAAHAEADDARKVHWPQWVIPLASAVLSAVIALGSVYLAAQFTADQQREKESREKRAQVYLDFLAGGRRYMDALEQSHDRNGEGGTLDKAFAAQQAWDRQRDLVYVYGSDEAWSAAEAMDQQLNDYNNLAPHADIDEENRLLSNYLNRELDFRDVFCREEPAEPRGGCNLDPSPRPYFTQPLR